MNRPTLIRTVASYVEKGAVVQIEDSKGPRGDRFRYEIRPAEGAMQIVDDTGRMIGVFADVAALVDHAEVITR